MDREEAQYMKEMQDLLWKAYDVLLNIPYDNPHRKEAVNLATDIVDLLEVRHLSSKCSGRVVSCPRCGNSWTIGPMNEICSRCGWEPPPA
jgi:hypothetical protein